MSTVPCRCPYCAFARHFDIEDGPGDLASEQKMTRLLELVVFSWTAGAIKHGTAEPRVPTAGDVALIMAGTVQCSETSPPESAEVCQHRAAQGQA